MTIPRLTRSSAHSLVLDAVQASGLESAAVLYGSWYAGDFHLDERRQISYSDVDLLLPGIDRLERERLADIVHSALRPILNIVVSTRPDDDLNFQDIQIDQWLSLASFASALGQRNLPADLKEYHVAKVLLMINRLSRAERYADVCRRLGTREALNALNVKLGNDSVLSPGCVQRLSSLVSSEEVVDTFYRLSEDGLTDKVAKSIIGRLVNSGSVRSSLVRHTAVKLGLI